MPPRGSGLMIFFLPEPGFRFFTGQDRFFLAWPKTRLNVASDIPSCSLILFRGTIAFQSSTATHLSSMEKFGTALQGEFLLASIVLPILILDRPHALPFISSQTESFCLKTLKFYVEQPETHRATEKNPQDSETRRTRLHPLYCSRT